MKKKPVVYIAGFECFMPEGRELAQAALDLCEKMGFDKRGGEKRGRNGS